MSRLWHCRGWRAPGVRRLWAEKCASQIVEFALSLPILVFFVVGIFDFSGALSLKQKLTLSLIHIFPFSLIAESSLEELRRYVEFVSRPLEAM